MMGASRGGPSVSGGTTSASGSNSRVGAGDVTTTTSSASIGSVTGGLAPYTYSWEHVSGDEANVNFPTSSSTTFSRTVTVALLDDITKDGIYRGKVTDANGAIGYGPNCTVTTQHTETT